MNVETATRPTPRKIKPLPARAQNEMPTDTVTDEETENHVGGLERSLSDFRLDNNLVHIMLLHSPNVCN